MMDDILKRLSYRCDCTLYIGGAKCKFCAAGEEITRLRAELAECRSKPQELHLHANGDSIDCRTCDRYTVFHSGYLCGLTKSVAVIVCIKGDAYIPADPVRLYETGGE